ncbi:MAG: sugar ABC transporter substrate-binding protein [Actinobacteria bacterium]|nr:sugar ABC transporter substrate-binding protein [Actinomycetota bacterium]
MSNQSRKITRRALLQQGLGAAAALTGLSILSGCGSSAPAGSAASTTAPAGSAAPTSAPAAGSAPASTSAPAVAKKVTLQYWTFLDPKDPGPRSVAQGQIIDAFQKKHPEIQIATQVMAWQQIDPQLMQAVGAGKGPDVTRINITSVAMNTKAGNIIPLTPWTDKWPQATRDDFAGDWSGSLINGQKMTLPIGVATTIFCWRKDLLDKTGMKVPTTWEDFATVAKALTKDPVWGAMVGLSRQNDASNIYQVFLPQVWSYGGDVFDGAKATLEGPAWVKTFQYWKDMVQTVKASPQDVVNATTDTILQGFMAGTYATMFNQTQKLSQVSTSKSIPPNSMGVGFMPGENGKPGPNPLGGWQIGMSKDVKEKDAAWLFIDHMMTPEMQLLNAKVAQEVPSRKSVGSDPWFKTPGAADMAMYFRSAAESGKAISYPENFNSLCDKLAIAIQQVIANNAPIESALKKAQDDYNAGLS